jgi:hypothetical protein
MKLSACARVSTAVLPRVRRAAPFFARQATSTNTTAAMLANESEGDVKTDAAKMPAPSPSPLRMFPLPDPPLPPRIEHIILGPTGSAGHISLTTLSNAL